MKILDLRVMRGANYWSNYRKKLIVMKLDIGELERYPTNLIPGFDERIYGLIPSLQTHRCSEDFEGGFLSRVSEGIWIGHVIEHIALEIQCLAGMESGYGRTRSTNTEGVYHVVFSYIHERAGLHAAKAAVKIAEALINNEPYDLDADIEILKRINRRESFGPSTLSIVNEAERRKIPWRRMDDESMILFGQGKNQKSIKATISGDTSSIAVNMACDKAATKKILSKACIPLPLSKVIYDRMDIKPVITQLGFPLVVKPLNGNHGRGVTIGIKSEEEVATAFDIAQAISAEVIVEQYVPGFDYRFLVINYKLVAVAKRTPPFIKGDGISTVHELIDKLNADPKRGEGHMNLLTKVNIDSATLKILARHDQTLTSILPHNELLFLKETANLSTGGTAADVTDKVHPANIFLAERIAKLMHLDICGIDIIARDINVPITDRTGAVIEVNAAPGFRMHLAPSKGLPRNVAAPVIDMLFPNDNASLIPVIAVTGTNGKTTTTRLCAHFAKQAGHKVGFTTTDGIYIQDHLIKSGDCTGPSSARVVLTDPTIDFAVLECARGGILRAGLGFDNCNISIITNVTDDHLGLNEIHSIEEMAKVKSVVARSTFDNGYAILNADDDLVFAMRKELDCNIALFSLDQNNERIIRHCENGGLAAFVEDNYIVVCNNEWKTRIEKINTIPLTLNGRAECMIKNILPAVLSAVISKFSIEQIRTGLKSFIPSAQLTPGRFNIFKFQNLEVMVDYAHNADGYRELKKFLDKTPATCKIGIVAATGDRREEDIRNVGLYAAEMFDEIIIRHDKDMRGLDPEKANELITQGAHSVNPLISVQIISDEIDAVQHLINVARPGSFVVLCVEKIMEVLDFLTEVQKKEENVETDINYEFSKAS
ncbi:MAG: cyanophycin synthetase [Chitinophagales bacterium]